jgi:malate dehydrogenase
MSLRTPVHVALTGAAGNIGYALAFRIAGGDLLGPRQPVILHLIEVEAARRPLEALVMELHDCAAPLLYDVLATTDLDEGFGDADWALLVGARPRAKGMERSDLIEINARIFAAQGQALNRAAKRQVRVVVVGNPANTNALIALSHAPRLNPHHFTAMTRLDHNRAVSLLARHTGHRAAEVRRVAIWGNHSTTQYPDLHHATVAGRPALELVEWDWYTQTFIPEVQHRGARVIEMRGASSAGSAANALIDHVQTWAHGTPEDDWTSMAVWADGSYGIEEGVFYSFPVTCALGEFDIVQGLDVAPFSRERMTITDRELRRERDRVRGLLGPALG